MAKILVLSAQNGIGQEDFASNSYNCSCNTEEKEETIDSILSSDFCTSCPKCIAKFKERIAKAGMFKCLWEPVMFKRNKAKFFHATSKYYLELDINICDPGHRMSRKHFPSHFSGSVFLSISSKNCAFENKKIQLFDLWCSSEDTELKKEYLEKMREYLIETFGIDINKWNEITAKFPINPESISG